MAIFQVHKYLEIHKFNHKPNEKFIKMDLITAKMKPAQSSATDWTVKKLPEVEPHHISRLFVFKPINLLGKGKESDCG